MRYLDIADELRSLIASGGYGAGGALPSEAELGERFSASRMTVRRALEQLRAEGLARSRKGSGWFASVDPLTQVLGRFGTIESNVAAAGLEWRREVLEFAFEDPPQEVAEVLDLDGSTGVLRVRRRNLVSNEPFALVTVWIPEALAGAISRADAEARTFYELLSRDGGVVSSAVQTITAEPADEDDARELGVPRNSPMLVCHRVTTDAEGAALLYSEHRYPAHRTAFEVELPHVEPAGGGPVGLRLVEDRRAASGS